MKKRISIYLIGLLAVVFSAFFILAAYGAEPLYNVVWNAADIDTGNFSSYEGLSSVIANELTVTENGRTYNSVYYSKTIKTNGNANVGSNYVPTKRAFKFTTEQPCFLKILAYGTSTGESVQPIFISRNGELVAELNLRHNVLTSNIIFLDSADTYYIYCTTGSFGICYMDLNMTKGDLNGDQNVDKYDLTVFYKMIYNSDDFNSVLLEYADLNSDGVLNENDVVIMNSLIAAENNYVPTYYNSKEWVIDNYMTNVSYKEETDLDGMVLVPNPDSTTTGMSVSSGGNKYYGNNRFINFIATNGAASLNTDKTVKSRGIKIYVSEPCYLTVLVRVMNTEEDEPKLTISKPGEVVASADLIKNTQQGNGLLQRVNVYLDEPNEYSICNLTGGINIYYVGLSDQKNAVIELSKIDTVWNFSDEEFTGLGSSYVVGSSNVTVDGLTLVNGIHYKQDDTYNTIRGEKFKDYILMGTTTSCTTKKSVYFDVKGTCDIYVICRSNDGESDRKLSMYSEKNGTTQTITVNEENGYCFRYTGSAGRVYLYSSDNVIRVYSIAVKSLFDYGYVKDDTVWDFTDSSIQGNNTNDIDYNCMQIHATEENSVNISTSKYSTPEGFVFDYYVSLYSAGCNDYRSLSFGVPKNSYVYITAKVPTSGAERQLIVTNKYCSELKSDLIDSCINVDDKMRVYRFKYLGEGEEIYLKSFGSQIRIYQISIRKIDTSKYEALDYNFNDYTEGTQIKDLDDGNIHFSTGSGYSTIVADEWGNYTKALNINKGNSNIATKIYFPVSNSDSSFNGKMRTISVAAKGEGQKLYLANKYGYVYKVFELTEEAKEYNYNYSDGAETLYLYSYGGSGSVYVYSIKTDNMDYNDSSGSNVYAVSLNAGDTITCYFTCENIPDLSLYDYYISYNSTALNITDISFGPELSDISSSIDIIYEDNTAHFSIDDSTKTNWSGIIAVVTFEAAYSVKSNVGFYTYRRA